MADEQNGLFYASGIDTSGFEEGIERIEQSVSGLTERVESETIRVNELINQNIPEVSLDFVTNASQTLATIDSAYAHIDEIYDQNKGALRELEAEYRNLDKLIAEAGKAGDKEAVSKLKEQKAAIEQVRKARQDVIAETEKEADKLKQIEDAMKREAGIGMNLRQYIKATKDEMANLVLEAKRHGEVLDETKGRYAELKQRLGELTDLQGDMASQAKQLSNDEGVYAGLISGISGITGAFTAAQGAVSLFAGENEELQQIMLKVQSLMAITMGLQQVQQTLNKDSAFSLVTLNGLKQWWAKITIEATAAETTETLATEANTASKVKDTLATEAETISEQKNAAAKTENAGATMVETVAQDAQTASAGAGTAANWSLAAAFKAVGLAIKSIPVFGWILAGISALIGLVALLTKKTDEEIEAEKREAEQREKLQKIQQDYISSMSSSTASMASKYEQLRREWSRLKSDSEKNEFIKKNKDLFHELGLSVTSVSDAESIFVQNTEAVKNSFEARAKAAAAMKAIEAAYEEYYKKLNEADNSVAGGGYYNPVKEGENIGRKDWKKYGLTESDFTTKKSINPYTGDMFDVNALTKEGAAKVNEVRQKAAKELNNGIKEDAKKILDETVKNYTKYYDDAIDEINSFSFTLKGNESGDSGSGNPSDKAKFDKEQAILREHEAIEGWKDAVLDYLKDANDTISDYDLKSKEEGLAKELAQIDHNTDAQIESWKSNLMRLAEARKNSLKEVYMSKEGSTEVGWSKSEAGQKSVDEYAEELLKQKDIAEKYNSVLANIKEDGEKQKKDIQQKYTDEMIQQYGNSEQKLEVLTRKWQEKLSVIPAEYLPEAMKQMEKELSAFGSENFKNAINWDSVFGDLEKQSLSSLRYSLDKIKSYFEQNRDSMSGTEIKDYTEAIKNMENEIANRNPFTALHKSLKDISTAKTEFTSAIQEWRAAQDELTLAQNAYNEALSYENDLRSLIDTGELTEDSEEYRQAIEGLSEAKNRLNNATEKNTSAEQKTLTARNNITVAYRTFANNLKSVGSVVSDIGGKAKNLASIFNADVAKGIEKAIDTIEEVLDAADTVINTIGDTGKSVAKGLEATAESSAGAMTATATAASTAISTVEKASVILTVISAALQVATAIASLFNDDDSKQKEIEGLQERIDQLQWELDNMDAMRLQRTIGDAYTNLTGIIENTRQEVINLHLTQVEQQNAWNVMIANSIHQNEILGKSIEKIADLYASVGYTADKALGGEKYADARKQLENLAEQQILIEQQIEAERSKKDTDESAINDWKKDIAELAEEMATLINDMLEEVIGYSAEDLASELGSAFFDAAKQGEDAMESWHKKVNEIVADVMKRMLVQKFIEERIGTIFDKYKKEWFGDKGDQYNSQKVIESMGQFAEDLNNVGDEFKNIYDTLPDNIKEWFAPDAETQEGGSTGGFNAMSQETGSELSGRFAALQIAGEETKNLVGEIKLVTDAVNENVQNIRMGMEEIQNINLLQLAQLESINKNTHEMFEMNEHLTKIERNTTNL